MGRRSSLTVVPRPHVQGISHGEPAGRSLPRGLEHHGPRYVASPRGDEGVRRSHTEPARRPVEHGGEHRRGVGSGWAEPFDVARRRHQGVDLTVGQERILGDGGKRTAGRLIQLVVDLTSSARRGAVLARLQMRHHSRIAALQVNSPGGHCSPPLTNATNATLVDALHQLGRALTTIHRGPFP